MTSIPDRCRKEIVELHQFFMEWFNGDLPGTDHAFFRFSNVLDERFTMVTPEAQVCGREEILQMVRGAHGRRRAEGGIRLWIENVQVRAATTKVFVATYEEWQATAVADSPGEEPTDGTQGAGEPRGRLSTVVFQDSSDDSTLPHGVRWLHVHETWLGV